MVKCPDWKNPKERDLFWSTVPEGSSCGGKEHAGAGARSQLLLCICSPVAEKEQEIGPDNRTSMSAPTMNFLQQGFTAFPSILHPSQSTTPWQIGTRDSNSWAYGGHFTFKPQQDLSHIQNLSLQQYVWVDNWPQDKTMFFVLLKYVNITQIATHLQKDTGQIARPCLETTTTTRKHCISCWLHFRFHIMFL